MTRRLPIALVAIAASLLAVSGLAACRSNVGTAATVNGHKISESDVSKYLTAKAQPFQATSSNGVPFTVAPRVIVLNTLIQDRLVNALEPLTTAGVPSKSELDAAVGQALQGHTSVEAAEQNGMKGYTADFDAIWVRVQVAIGKLRDLFNSGSDKIENVLAKLTFHATVNPRYGSWDDKNLTLAGDPTAGLPSYLHVQSTSPAPAPSTSPSG